MITAVIDAGQHYCQAVSDLWQWDYGQTLRIQGVKLPAAVEVQFSTTERIGETVTRIGVTKEGVTEVPIPDTLLDGGGTTQDYTIYAFVYIENGDSGKTEYRVSMKVRARPKPEAHATPEEGELFRQAIVAVTESADRAESARKSAQVSADEAKTSKENAETAAKVAEAFKTETETAKAEAVQAAADATAAKKSAEEARAAAEKAKQDADADKEATEAAQAKAEAAQVAAENAEAEAKKAQTATETARRETETAKTAVETMQSTVAGYADNANIAKESAETAKAEAETAKNDAAQAKEAAEKAKSGTAADREVTEAASKAAQVSATSAEESAKKAETAKEEIQESTDQIQKNATEIDSLKEDIGDLNTSVFNIEESPNIFDKTKINQNKALVTWGTPTMTNYTYDKTGWVTSYPIAVHGGSTIHVYKFEDGGIKNQDVANLVTFAKDGSFIAIEGQNKNEIKLSENTAYIIFDISNLTFIDSLMLTTEPYNGAYKEYGRIKEDKIAKNAEDILKLKEDKTHIIFSFDAFKIDNRFELMKSYGFPFTIAIASTILTYPISKEDYYNYFIDGDVDFSIYAGKGDRPTDYRSDKDKWSAWVKGLVDGLKETSGLYYPVMYSCQNAASSDILNQVVKENGFRMCRNGTYYNADGTTTWGILTDRKYLIDGTKYFDYYPLSVVKQEGYPTVEQIKAEIDNAIEKKKSIMLFTHYVVDDTKTMSDTDCPLSKFTAVLDYVKEKVDAGLCDVKNARQFWNYYNQQDGLDIDYKRTNMRNLFDTTH